MPDPASLTATDAARRIRFGLLTPADLMEACLERIAGREPTLRAMAWLDPAQARAAAAAAVPGPLHGLPIGVKDVLDTADMPSEYNSDAWRGHRPRADAACVAWARAAGAAVVGKTVTTEFAVRVPGPTTNPHNAAHTPGGSSSGSAAAVADGYFPLAFATQTAGSIIRPAAFCGAVGYKPSFGTVSRTGMKIMADSLDTIGAIARSVADCALFVGAVAGIDLGEPDTRPDRAPRVGICRSPSWGVADATTQALLPWAAEILAAAGATIVERELPAAFDAIVAAHPVVQNMESARSLGWELTTRADKVSATLRAILEPFDARPFADLAAARATLRDCQAAFAATIDDLDILLTPSAPGEAPEGIEWTGDPSFNFIWTALHVPCVTVPAGTGALGLPLGLQVVAPRGQDRAALAWAQWIAAAIA